MSDSVEPYQALLLLSFGGPEQPGDVVPFLENVTAGRGIPRERLERVGEHYFAFGGRSPINGQNRALLAALRQELAGRGVDLSVYWGNRNWQPFVVDALREAHEAGARRVLTVATSAYASYSGCRQYREDLAAALIHLAGEGRELVVDKVRHYYNHPGFVQPMARAVLDAIEGLPQDVRDGAHLAFVTHSIPTPMNESSGPRGGQYESQHLDVAREVVRRVADVTGRELPWRLVYCSRSGPPSQPWLEPDVNDHLRTVHVEGASAVVAVPIGFVSDHMEVKYDLDTEARETARELRLPYVRAATVGTTPAFVSALVDLALERAALERAALGQAALGQAALGQAALGQAALGQAALDQAAHGSGGAVPPRPAVGDAGPSHDICPAGCCPNPRADRPAACGTDWPGPRVLPSSRSLG